MQNGLRGENRQVHLHKWKTPQLGVLLLLLPLLSLLLSPASGLTQSSELARQMGALADKLAFATKGQVLAVKGKIVYIDLGQPSGIVEGNKFEVVRLGAPLVVGDKVLGYEETIVGEIEIFRVREQMAIAKVVTQEQAFQKGDRVYQRKKQIRRVAVPEFPYGNTFNDFTKNIQDLLYTNLIQKGMSIVERQKLEEVLQEQKIAYSGIIDLSTAAQVGKILGVEGVVVGSVADLGNALAITARLVDVETGTAITAARVELVKTTDMGDLLRRGSRGATAQAFAEPRSSVPSSIALISPGTSEKHLNSEQNNVIVLTKINRTATAGGILIAPGRGKQSYTVFHIDTRNFHDGGTLIFDIQLGHGESDASFDLFPEGVVIPTEGRPRGSIAHSYNVSSGSRVRITHRFATGQIFQFGATGNWLSRKGAKNTFTLSIRVE